VEGVGHFEPLRHYAEVHLLLEPLPQGSGLVFDSDCSGDVLDINFQRLVMTHLSEKTHRGVLTGAPITDMKLTLMSGRAHIKHTEGGDFRQATYRAVRQGLMRAQSVLLEPWYDFTLLLPAEQVGRAITDIRAMSGQFDTPESADGFATLKGTVPASELKDYADQLAAYTQGRGQLQLTLHGYAPCHNTQAVVDAIGYDPEADLENTPDSVFCAHGAGFTVKWHQVPEYMHLESCLKQEKEAVPALITRNLQPDDKALEAIMEREFGPIKRPVYTKPQNRPATEKLTIHPPRQQLLIVDGYNIIFASEALAQQALSDLDAARRQLCDLLSSYAGFKKCRVVLVFDGYKVKGNPGTKTQFHNIQVVYTMENETADAYIETLVADIGSNYAVRVATSDALVQLSSLRSGVIRVSARELLCELEEARKEMRSFYKK
jgi:predicted RNA-binding protein with PIN domain